MTKIQLLVFTLILTSLAFADREPSPFEGTYQVTRTNMETGKEFTEELRISWFGGYYLLENIQGGPGGELIEQEGIEYSGWMAAGSIEYGGTIGLYRMDGQGITGVELYVPDTTFYVIKSEGARPLELKKQWARGLYQHMTYYGDEESLATKTELIGVDELWEMRDYIPEFEEDELSSYGLSAENGVATLYEFEGNMVVSLYTITGGNLEGRWLSTWWDDVEESFMHETGGVELWVLKIYE